MTRTILLLLSAGLIGCTTGTVNTAGPERTTANEIEVRDERVTTDSELAKQIRLVGLNESVTPNGMRRVQAEFRNRTDKVQRFQIQWEWFDENGMRVDSPLSRWRHETIAGGETKFLIGTAPTTSSTDFKLKVIRPEN